MFEYDHGLLSLIDLHGKGVRHTRELEEVIEGHSFADEIFFEPLGYSVIRFIGFTNASRALKIACRLDEKNEKLITLDTRIPSVEEIVKDFCRYC
jgi:uncharacterized Rossmann fold enzyme